MAGRTSLVEESWQKATRRGHLYSTDAGHRWVASRQGAGAMARQLPLSQEALQRNERAGRIMCCPRRSKAYCHLHE